ncbi:uncharacterized protein LOC112345361 isoform X2 [Selaginella moellendorffii]|uniref:uncharacterized protein LOC112345361 isoform X2 n=1 Tax=Selaginella moellendorffii TaxID=88036 RepID=UPI000D1C7775|nr:uncharacterized protein LOC112345361 isoform X2 [Selaginella moellendorffii]|eukprot:XP_024527665.1 uncharacterized protein LOC112345361 isoform X2 [Selaginella moellendorffii]
MPCWRHIPPGRCSENPGSLSLPGQIKNVIQWPPEVLEATLIVQVNRVSEKEIIVPISSIGGNGDWIRDILCEAWKTDAANGGRVRVVPGKPPIRIIMLAGVTERTLPMAACL